MKQRHTSTHQGYGLEKLFICEVVAIGIALSLYDEQCSSFLLRRSVWAYGNLDIVGGKSDCILCFTVKELGEEDIRESGSLVSYKTNL